VSAGNGSYPLPAPYFPDFARRFDDPKQRLDFFQQLQDNFERLQLQVGSNADTSAPSPLTGLYAGTWGPYTGTAGFTPYYSKKAGIVVMGGAVTNGGNFVAGQTMMTMPVGFRPASTEQYPALGVGGGPTTGIAIVQVAATGVMTFISGISGGGLANPMTYISLSVIEYGAAA
jgi:hypothetical protein